MSMYYFSIANLDEAACRQAMIEFVNQNCCYGSKPAQEMQITKHFGMTALHVSMHPKVLGTTPKVNYLNNETVNL